MPSTRRARRERAHRQCRARAGAAPQRDVGRPSPALRGDGGVAAAIRRRAGCCGGGGGGGAGLRQGGVGLRAAARPSWATARSSTVRASALTPFQLPLLFLGGPPPPPRCAQQAVRSGCCVGQLTVRAPARVRVVFADGAQVRAREGRGVATRSSRSLAPSWAMPGLPLHPRQTQQPFRGVLDKRRALTCRTESCRLALQRLLLLAVVQNRFPESL